MLTWQPDLASTYNYGYIEQASHAATEIETNQNGCHDHSAAWTHSNARGSSFTNTSSDTKHFLLHSECTAGVT